jgi:hypothetical protein
MSYTVIPWSGGADSTLLVAHRLAHGHRVKALTLHHPQLAKCQAQRESWARRAFLDQIKAKSPEWLDRFEHHTVSISSKRTRTSRDKSELWIDDQVGQSGLWLCHLTPYLYVNDTLAFAYIREDDFWHQRHLFIKAFAAMVAHHHMGRNLVEFPFEFHRKADILRGLKKYRIPQRWDLRVPAERCARVREVPQVRPAQAGQGRSEAGTVRVQRGSDPTAQDWREDRREDRADGGGLMTKWRPDERHPETDHT